MGPAATNSKRSRGGSVAKSSEESAAERRARIDAAMQAGVGKRVLPGEHSRKEAAEFETDRFRLREIHGHDPDGGRVEQWEKNRRAVFQALGHDVDGKCPAGVDWRNLRAVASREGAKHTKTRETLAAYERASSRFHHVGATTKNQAEMAAKSSACGWWWCTDKDRLKDAQWKDLVKALAVLGKQGIKPSGVDVARIAGTYAEFSTWRKRWPIYKGLQSLITNPLAVADLKAGPSVRWLRKFNLSQMQGATKQDKPMQLFLNKVYDPSYWRGDCGDYYDHDVGDVWIKGTPAVASAILCLFGLGKKSERIEDMRKRIKVVWRRPGDLVWGRPSDPTGRQKSHR